MLLNSCFDIDFSSSCAIVQLQSMKILNKFLNLSQIYSLKTFVPDINLHSHEEQNDSENYCTLLFQNLYHFPPDLILMIIATWN